MNLYSKVKDNSVNVIELQKHDSTLEKISSMSQMERERTVFEKSVGVHNIFGSKSSDKSNYKGIICLYHTQC